MSPREPIDQTARDAIRSDLDRSLCVEAGAGTGKTSSLVGRIVELLASRTATVDEIAVMTFTEKAAAELSTRVREQLEAQAQEEQDPERQARLATATAGLYRAHIETIHAFAASLLHERPIEAGLDPQFQVLASVESQLHFDSAYREWLDELLATEREEVERAFNLGFGELEIRECAELLDRFRYLLPLNLPDSGGDPTAALLGWLEANLPELHAIEGRCLEPDDKGATQLRELFAFADLLEAEGNSASARDRLLSGRDIPFLAKNAGSRGHWENGGDCGRMKDLVCEFRDLQEPLADQLRSAALLGVLPHIERFALDYAGQRKAEGLASYDDLLIWARDLLRERPEVRQYFQDRFRFLLIDEFQDTDPIQAEIAILLTSTDEGANWREILPEPGRLFVVGDPKQSIYRFRRADIAIYDSVKRGALDGDLEQLTQNFRSSKPIIDWVNRVFNVVLEEREGVQPANTELDAFVKTRIKRPARPPIVVPQLHDPELKADALRQRESEVVAALLHDAVERTQWEIRDRASGEVRGASWGDVAILLPKRTGLEAYEHALAGARIPYRHEGSRDYFQRQEVRDLISLLTAADDPRDSISVVAALRSSAFGCSDDDLVIHRATGGHWDYRPDTEGEAERVAAAFEMLRKLHYLRGKLSLPELVQVALEESRLVEYSLTLPDGAQAAANLLAIADQARSFSAAGGGGLRAFCRFLADSTEQEAVEVDAGIAEQSDDVVRILTMHGAKGLEFPIVVLANLGNQGRNDKEPVPDDDNSALHFRVGSGSRAGHFATPNYDDHWDTEKDAQRAEEVRLLYVAATRARDHLIVPDFKGSSRGWTPREILEPALPEVDGAHEVERDGAWVIDASRVEPIVVSAQARRRPKKAETKRVLADREGWTENREALVKKARKGREITVASSKEREGRPLAAEASAGDGELIVSEGPPLPAGDALHLVMERVSLPDARDLDAVVEATCAEAGIPERAGEVTGLARRCLDSSSVARALASEAWQREVPFTHATDRGYSVGRVDLAFTGEDGKLVVIDFKTDAVDADDAERHVATAHSDQAQAYADGLRATGAVVASVVFVICRAGAEVVLDVAAT